MARWPSFVVALALGVDISIPRKEWENYDLVLPDGAKVEVKSSGYWQSWKQKQASAPAFGGLITRKLEDETNAYTIDREVWADVYVFALQRCEVPHDYDALDIDQWRFWVTPAEVIRRENRQSVTLSWVQKNASGPLHWGEIQAAVVDALAAEERQAPASQEGGVWVPDEPVLFIGRRESEWQQAIGDRLARPYISIRASSSASPRSADAGTTLISTTW